MTETTALGAAYLAGLAVGYWSDAAEVTVQWAVDRRFEPQLSSSTRLARLARWRQAVQRCRDWAEH